LHLEEVIRGALNVLAYLMSVRWTVKERPEDEHIERALENGGTLLSLFVSGSHSTLNTTGW